MITRTHPMEDKLTQIFTYVKARGFNLHRVERAYELAKKLHEPQTRKSGEPYVFHLIAVTAYLTEYNADEDSIIAGFLHDAVEDTAYTLEDVDREFGPKVSKLIHGMTKFSKTHFQDEASLNRKIESLRKWFEVMQDDIRVGVIKLFDRLHNIETLNYHGNIDKERAIAKETLDIHVKIARKLGLYELKAELERLCLPYIDPKNAELFQYIRITEEETCERLLPKIQYRIEGQDTEDRIIEIKHRPLTLSDVYEFGLHAKENIEGTIPLIVTITTSTIKDCYYVLYLLHSIWQAERGSFEDYINAPAVSGYRGLHTKVLLAGGRELFFKIMTKEMEEYRKFGVTKFCFQGDSTSSYHKLPEWISRISHVIKEERNNSENFWEQLQNDILAESMTIYTDRGGKGESSLLLPSHATALDAAFYAYGEQGLYVEQIFVNGRKVPPYHHLNAEDTVAFIFGFTLRVTYEWVQFVDTSFAFSYVREGLKAHDNISKISRGKEILQEAFFREGKGLFEELQQKRTDELLEHFALPNTDTLFQLIAEGEILPERIIEFLYPSKSFLSSSQKIIKARGSFSSITMLFESIPEVLKEKLRWSIKTTRSGCNVSCMTTDITPRQWRQLLQYFEAAEGVTITVKSNFWDYRKTFVYIPLINLLVGLDPLVASYFLSSISPQGLTVIRFVASSFFLYIFILLTSPYRKTVKKLPLFSPIIIILSFLLATVGFATYQTLSVGTTPSTYLLLLETLVWVMLFAHLIFRRPLAIPSLIFSVLGLATGLIFLFSNPMWSFTAKLWALIVLLGYGFYAYINTYFRKKEKVEIRQLQFLLLIFLYASIISICGLFFLPLDTTLTPLLLVGSFAYSIIFTCIPFILHSKLLKQFRSALHVDTMFLNWAFAIGLLSEILLLQLYPSIEKVVAIVAIYTAIFLLFPFVRHQVIDHHS